MRKKHSSAIGKHTAAVAKSCWRRMGLRHRRLFLSPPRGGGMPNIGRVLFLAPNKKKSGKAAEGLWVPGPEAVAASLSGARQLRGTG